MLVPASRLAAAVLAASSACVALAGGAPAYIATDLGTLGGFGANVFGVNDLDQAVGASDTVFGAVHAFIWDKGVMTDLGTLPGGDESRAFGINNKSEVVGVARNAQGQDRAVLWKRDLQGVWQITDLGLLPDAPANGFSLARRINEHGQIVGLSSSVAGPPHAFILTGGVMTDLGILHYPENWGHSEALALNDLGEAAGYAYAPLFGPDHGFHYDGTSVADITPPGQFGFARGESINNQGLIAGIVIQTGGASTGFEAAIFNARDPRAGWTELGVLSETTESEAYDVNESGAVVGFAYDLGTQVYKAFLWSGGAMHELTDIAFGEPAPITEAYGVNEQGTIAANANGFDGAYALLLRIDRSCAADLNGDGVVSAADLASMLGLWGLASEAGDLNGDGVVGPADLASLLGAWGSCE